MNNSIFQIGITTWKGFEVKALVEEFTYYDGSTSTTYRISEGEVAEVMECSAVRVHNAVIRYNKAHYVATVRANHPYHINKNARVVYDNAAYNPIWIFDAILPELATRRPYVVKAREALNLRSTVPK